MSVTFSISLLPISLDWVADLHSKAVYSFSACDQSHTRGRLAKGNCLPMS